jgi:hypothetical protein
MWLGKVTHGFLYLIEQGLVHDCRVMVRNDVPLRPVLHAMAIPADFQNRALANDVGAGIPFVLQNPQDG